MAGLCLALLPGCAAPVVVVTAGVSALQVGTAAFINGEIEAAFAKPMPEMFVASEGALNDLKFPIRRSKLDEYNAYVYSNETQRRRIEIDLEKKSDTVTKINIRVGFFGDQAMSRLILATIQARLGSLSSQATDP